MTTIFHSSIVHLHGILLRRPYPVNNHGKGNISTGYYKFLLFYFYGQFSLAKASYELPNDNFSWWLFLNFLFYRLDVTWRTCPLVSKPNYIFPNKTEIFPHVYGTWIIAKECDLALQGHAPRKAKSALRFLTRI